MIFKEVKNNLVFNEAIIIITSRLIDMTLIDNFKRNYNKDFIVKIVLQYPIELFTNKFKILRFQGKLYIPRNL